MQEEGRPSWGAQGQERQRCVILIIALVMQRMPCTAYSRDVWHIRLLACSDSARCPLEVEVSPKDKVAGCMCR